MRGRKTPEHLIDEIRRLRKAYPAAEVVRRMAGKLPRRTVYRILGRLRREDEERLKETVEKGRRAYELEEQQRRERVRRMEVRKYTKV
jgi:hypothetical protein